MSVLVAFKNKEDPIKHEGARVVAIWPNFEPMRDFSGVFVACKLKKIHQKK